METNSSLDPVPTSQRNIINELGVKPELVPEQEIHRRVSFLSEYLAATSLKGYVLGISGGQDSLLAGTLAQMAVEQRRKDGHEASFHAVLLPYGTQTDQDDARLACEFIEPDYLHEWNILGPTDAFAREFSYAEGCDISDFHKGNVKARMRMVAQYALAGTYDLLVIGTDHAAEAVTGFFTKYGDGGADILPLSGLTKRQGRLLLQTLGAPSRIYTKAPTADLLDNQPARPDENELGLSYQDIDDYLEGKIVPTRIANQIEERYRLTEHKRTLPVTPPSST